MNEWLLIRSWHIVRTWTRVPNQAITLCGRRAAGLASHAEPLPTEKTCETCLRLRVLEPA